MPLNETPEFIIRPTLLYVFVEKIGPFLETAKAAWEEFYPHLEEIRRETEIIEFAAHYKMQPEMRYRSGVAVATHPAQLPVGLKSEFREGGRYARFLLTGPYDQLVHACGRVFDLVRERNLDVRDDFYIEHYVNNPDTTPPDKLLTEILIPVK